MSSKTLFDSKFENLKNFYIIHDEKKVYEFIKENENLFELLEAVKPSLNKHFKDKEYLLEVRCYPEIYKPELGLIIITDSNGDAKEITEKFLKFKLEITEFQIELGLTEKFFTTLE